MKTPEEIYQWLNEHIGPPCNCLNDAVQFEIPYGCDDWKSLIENDKCDLLGGACPYGYEYLCDECRTVPFSDYCNRLIGGESHEATD